jgi:glycosyltransferase involved in cell wall biosynthesis
MNSVVLSVCLITYNHEEYLRQAIEGVLMQKVDFSWELVIADDYSTDGTREIILEYTNRYPDFIKVILQERNVGAASNFIDLLSASKAEYIAYFEGDDFWTDPLKLQKQVDFLKLNQEYVCHCHNANVMMHDNIIRTYTDLPRGNMTKETFLGILAISTGSILFRNVFQQKIPKILSDLPQDTVLFFYLFEFGAIYFSDEIMLTYRIQEKGAWNSQNELTKVNKLLYVLNYISNNFHLISGEKRQMNLYILSLRQSRIKINANGFRFGVRYWADVLTVLIRGVSGYPVKAKFFIFCLIPQPIVDFINRYRSGKNISKTLNNR